MLQTALWAESGGIYSTSQSPGILSCHLVILGWKTVLHYGSLIGAYSLITLLPELHLGIFSSYNGAIQYDPYTINSLLHVHLIDLFLGAQPSIDNTSYWCSLSGVGARSRSSTRGSPLYTSSAYVGVYWHEVLGEFEVWDNGTGTLMARYGSVETRLEPLQSGVEFIGVPTDPAWLMLFDSMIRVEFEVMNLNQLRYRDAIVSLFVPTTFQRRDEDVHSAAVSALPTTVTSTLCLQNATVALASLILTLLLHYASL